MKKETEEKLACSLTAETTALLPFLPYLLKDFWELGSEPEVMIQLMKQYVDLSEDTKVLDLACGKGAVSVKTAHQLGVKVKGIDIIPEFIQFAEEKAKEYHVEDLCTFSVLDINEAVEIERDYDCVIFGAVGGVLGSPGETLKNLKKMVKQGGYILIDEGYLPDDGDTEDVKFNNTAYLTKTQWTDLFQEMGLILLDTVFEGGSDNLDSDDGLAAITARAKELMEQHPDKKEIFVGYIRSQQNEYDDIDSNITCVTWILQKS